MALTLYGLKNCDTCRKAIKALGAAGADVQFVDIRSEADLPDLVPQWLDAVGAKALLNSRSTTWRGLDEDTRAAASDTPDTVLIAHPALIKRPVIMSEHATTVGWTADTATAHGV